MNQFTNGHPRNAGLAFPYTLSLVPMISLSLQISNMETALLFTKAYVAQETRLKKMSECVTAIKCLLLLLADWKGSKVGLIGRRIL